MDHLRVYLLDPNAHRSPHYTSWESCLEYPSEVVTSYDADWEAPADAGVVITVCHYSLPEVSILRRLTEQRRVPVLILSDGILEYRNTFDHPDVAPGAIFQPVFGHKIACIGRSQVRMLESWGNLGKCELVGVPRLDQLRNRQPRRRAEGEAFRILIATARMPAFTPHQSQRLYASLRALRDWFKKRPCIEGVSIQPIWRLTQNWGTELAVDCSPLHLRDVELQEVLAQVDAVITTPSTVMLEGMMQGVPVALLDFNNCPHYVPAAWTMTAQEHFDQLIPELINIPAGKLLYQDTILHDALECRTPATPRMVQLVEEMIRIGQECRGKGKPLGFPKRILSDDQDGHHLPEERFSLQRLYPEHEVFANLDRTALQVEIGHLQRCIALLRSELEWKQQECQALHDKQLQTQENFWRRFRQRFERRSA